MNKINALRRRVELKKLFANSQKGVFMGKFKKFGSTTSWTVPDTTVCITNVKLITSGEDVAEHLWIKRSQISNFKSIKDIKKGEIIWFTAVPYRYLKEKGAKIMAVKYSLEDVTIHRINNEIINTGPQWFNQYFANFV